MRTGALFNKLWDGEPIRRLRVLTGKAFLPGRRCSAHVMMQFNVATRFFGDATLGGIGTLSRTLLVAPESAAGSRLWRETLPSAHAALDYYTDRLAGLLARAPRLMGNEAAVLDPVPLPLCPAARTVWIAFHDGVERALRPDCEFASIRAFASKMPEHAGRIAAVLEIYANPEAVEVSPQAIENGIILARHYAGELLRLRDAAAVAPELAQAQQLLAWWQARLDPVCHLAAIYQLGPNQLRDAATARRSVEILEEHGWVRRLEPGAEVDRKARREAWALVP